MANEFLNGTEVLMYIDTETPITTDGEDVEIPGSFRPFICGQDNGFDLSVDQIDTTSKCTGFNKSSIPGEVGWTFNFSGNAVKGVDGDSISHNEALELAKSRTLFWVAEFNPALDTVRYGVGYFTSYSDANPRNASQTFSVTVQGTGEIFTYPATT